MAEEASIFSVVQDRRGRRRLTRASRRRRGARRGYLARVATPASAGVGGGAPPAKEVYDIKRVIWGEGGRTLPPGVNPGKLEAYLSDAQFAEVLGMPRPQFGALSAADQMHIKRNVGLF